MQLLQLAARGLELALHVGCALAIGDCPPQPLSGLLDLQLSLDLLPEQSTGIFQLLLKLWVKNIPLIQPLQTAALKETPQQLQSLSLLFLIFLYVL